MGDHAYEVVKQYEISGIKVTSEVVKDELAPETGGRSLFIRSSCESYRWGTRSQHYSYGCPANWEEFEQNFERTRFQAAENLIKAELGQVPERTVGLLVPEIYGPTGKRITPASVANLSLSPTLLGAEVIQLLELQPTGDYYYEQVGNRVNPVALFGARIKFGSYEAETSVAPSNHGFPACVLGGDFFQKALAGKEELIHELVMPDHYRTLVNAARCKKKYVLIAGKYGEHRPRLERIKQALKSLDLVGLILDEYPDIEEQSLAEKMVTYASICRFVIVDDVAPSGHINELGICHERKFVTAVLRLHGRASTAMQSDIACEVAFLRDFHYTGDSDFERCVIDAGKWANEAVEERSRALNRQYSAWRSPDKIMR